MTLLNSSTRPILPRAIASTLLMIVVLFAYIGIQRNGFHFDDWHNILLNPAIQINHLSFATLLEAAQGASLPHRPIPSITFAIDWLRGGDNPAPFLLTNLGLHVLASWATLAFLLQIAVDDTPASNSRLSLVAVTVAAAWWAVHPIQVQAVSYVVQRMTELAALFSILCVWCYVNGRRTPTQAWRWWSLSLLSLALAALSKQNAWIAPILVLMAEFLIVRNGRDLIQHRADRWLLATPVVLALVAALVLSIDGPASRWLFKSYEWRDFTLLERVLTQPKVLLFHVSQMLWPTPGRFSLDHELTVVRTIASAEFWLPLGAIGVWCAWGLRLAARRGDRVIAFFVLWVPVTLIIESSIVPLEMIFEHRMYLPSVGFAGLLAIGLMRSLNAPRGLMTLAWTLMACATAFALWATRERLPQWKTEVSLLENSVRHAPNSVRAWNQLGIEYLAQGRLEHAMRAINRANEIEPRWGDGYPFVNRGVVLEAMGQRDQARAIYEETIRRFPRQVLGYNNRGLLYLRAGQFDLAVRDFDTAIAVDPTYAAAWTNRGTARFLQGDIRLAQHDLEKAVSLSPRESIAYHYLALTYAADRRGESATQARRQACRLGISTDCAQ